MNRNLLTVVVSAVVAVAVYSAVVVSRVEGYPAVIAMALGVFCVFLLFLGGLVDEKTAQKGLLPAITSVLPRFLDWSARFRDRTALVLSTGVAAAAALYWLGPAGVVEISLACDAAQSVAVDHSYKMRCNGALNASVWRTPWSRLNSPEPSVQCVIDRINRTETWPADSKMRRCGARPLEVQYIRNGIDLPEEITATAGTSAESARIAERHMQLRDLLSTIPVRDKVDNLLFATWNLRNFGGGAHRPPGYAPRTDEALIYIAETLSHFDLIAVQEIYDEAILTRLIDLMGPDYAYSLGAPSPGMCGGGREGLGERLGFVYDRRKLTLLGDNTTVVIDPRNKRKMLQDHPDWAEALEGFQDQPCRPPFFARFDLQGQAISAFTLHAYFGSQSGRKLARRLADVYRVFSYFRNYARNRLKGEVLLFGGDMNGIEPDGPVQKVAEELGFDFLGAEYQIPTSYRGNRPYDRIGALFPSKSRLAASRHGTVDLLSLVMRTDERLVYRPYFAEDLRLRAEKGRPVKNEERYYELWRTNQISDHRPKWVEFVILPETSGN